MNYTFSPNALWFESSEIKSLLFNFLKNNQVNNILEIGSYEGASSVFFVDNFLSHENSTLTCIDPFLSINDNDHKNILTSKQEENFLNNISSTLFPDKVTFQKTTSDIFFKKNTKKFNFIYIDGSHVPSQVVSDLDNAIKIISDNGIIWMDDYNGGDPPIRPVVDEYIFNKKLPIEIIHQGYQIAFRKIVKE